MSGKSRLLCGVNLAGGLKCDTAVHNLVVFTLLLSHQVCHICMWFLPGYTGTPGVKVIKEVDGVSYSSLSCQELLYVPHRRRKSSAPGRQVSTRRQRQAKL